MDIRVSEATTKQLDYMVSVIEGGTDYLHDGISSFFTLNGKNMVLGTGWAQSMNFSPSTLHECGGPIADREYISTQYDKDAGWMARSFKTRSAGTGETRLIASMRCHIIAHRGHRFEVPDWLA